MKLRFLAMIAALASLAIACSDQKIPPADPVTIDPSAQAGAQAQQDVAQDDQSPPQSSAAEDDSRSSQPAPQDAVRSVQVESENGQVIAQSKQAAQPAEQTTQLTQAPRLDVVRAAEAVIALAESLGPRPSGSDDEAAAAEHLATVLSSYGYAARIEPFTFSTEFPIATIFLSDVEDLFAARFRGSSNEAAAGQLLHIDGIGDATDYEGLDVADAVVLVHRGETTFEEKVRQAVAGGAAALIVINHNNDWFVGDLASYRSPIPVLGVSRIEGNNLARQAPQRVDILSFTGEQGQSQNVVAMRPDAVCAVLVGAHYDTVYRTAGYNDNSSGTALMLEFARIYADHPAADHLCFVGFGAEEIGLYGSREYVRRLEETERISDTKYMLNLDAISSGSAQLRMAVSGQELPRLIGRLARELETDVATIQPGGWGDDRAFADAGIATFFPLPMSGVMNTIRDDASNFHAEAFEAVAEIAAYALQCMLELSGAAIRPMFDCALSN